MSASRHAAGVERRRGSVLLPAVAAMLLLLLSGTALAELFSSQRMQTALSVESAQAFWCAEAGLWHAAHQNTALTTPVAFAGGSYTVQKSGNTYTAAATRGAAARTLSEALGIPPGSPLDEARSAATAGQNRDDKFTLNLFSVVTRNVEIAAFSLTANRPHPLVDKLKLAGKDIWRIGGGVALPTGTRAVNRGSQAERTVPAGGAPILKVDFRSDPTGLMTYTLVLVFTDGTSSTLVFTIDW